MPEKSSIPKRKIEGEWHLVILCKIGKGKNREKGWDVGWAGPRTELPSGLDRPTHRAGPSMGHELDRSLVCVGAWPGLVPGLGWRMRQGLVWTSAWVALGHGPSRTTAPPAANHPGGEKKKAFGERKKALGKKKKLEGKKIKLWGKKRSLGGERKKASPRSPTFTAWGRNKSLRGKKKVKPPLLPKT